MIVLNKAIEAGSDYANSLGFTSDKFDGYLWQKEENTIMISLIMSLEPNKGNFSKFVNGLIAKGMTVKVPTPFSYMKSILIHMGFKHTYEYDKFIGRVDVWVLTQ